MNMKTSTDTRIKNFKKQSKLKSRKNSNLTIQVPSSVKQGEKLLSLKQKLQKQKKMMEKSGRRFRQQTSMSTQQISIQTEPVKIFNNQQNFQKNNVSVEVSTTDIPTKQSISLSEIQFNNEKKSDNLSSSKIFQRQIQSQKKRSRELFNFLKEIELQKFTEPLIESGFDDVDILTEITTQDLNHIMMRAREQDRLMGVLKKLKGNIKQEPTVPLSNNPSILRMKTEPRPMTSQQSYPTIKTQANEKVYQKSQKKEEKKTPFMSSSFLFSVGGKNWSVDDQVRRACSGCFKMSTQMQKKGECYYCSKCFELLAGDLLTLSIDTSMSRSYKKL